MVQVFPYAHVNILEASECCKIGEYSTTGSSCATYKRIGLNHTFLPVTELSYTYGVLIPDAPFNTLLNQLCSSHSTIYSDASDIVTCWWLLLHGVTHELLIREGALVISEAVVRLRKNKLSALSTKGSPTVLQRGMLADVVDDATFESEEEDDELSSSREEGDRVIASALAMAAMVVANATIPGPRAKHQPMDPPVDESSIVSPRGFAEDSPAQPMSSSPQESSQDPSEDDTTDEEGPAQPMESSAEESPDCSPPSSCSSFTPAAPPTTEMYGVSLIYSALIIYLPPPHVFYQDE